MQCVNASCRKEVADGARFCPFCRTEQTSVQAPPVMEIPVEEVRGMKACSYCRQQCPDTALACSRCSTPFPAAVSTRPALSAGEIIVMRPGGAVWHAEEEEGEVAPGQRRPLLIMDEQVVHLARTDRRLDPAVLQARVQQLLAAQQVPVDVALVATRWLRDTDETRPRLVAWLRHHRFSDIKLLLGVDYMGSWASIQMHVGVEPEVRQHHHVQSKNWTPPWDAIVAIVLGVIGLLIFIGIFAIAYGAWRLYTSYKKYQVDNAEYIAQQRAQHAQRERRRAEERMSRTFKIDDMRLFCTAMRSVFQSVVDDIVEQGGEVTRIEGGKGGFFQEDGVTQPAAVQRRSDAAQVGV